MGEPDFGVAADAEDIGRVELDFGARVGSGGDAVVGEQRSIDHAGDPVARVAAADGNLAVHEADAGHSTLHVIGILRSGGRKHACRQEHCTRQGCEPEI